MLKQNKDLKSNSSLMERKVDELSDENGVLASQVMTHSKGFSLLNAANPLSEKTVMCNVYVLQRFNTSRLLLKQSHASMLVYMGIMPVSAALARQNKTDSHVSVLLILKTFSNVFVAGENSVFTAGHL